MENRDEVWRILSGRHEARNFGPREDHGFGEAWKPEPTPKRDGSDNYGRCEPWHVRVRKLRGGTPASYQVAEKIKATLLERAAKASAAAWRIEMEQRACRIADTDEDLGRALCRLWDTTRELSPMIAGDTGDMS